MPTAELPDYLAALEAALLSLFDRLPYETQPAGVLITGNVDPALFDRIRHVIAIQSARGKALRQHPLTLIGFVLPANGQTADSWRLEPMPGIDCRFLPARQIYHPERLFQQLAERSGAARGDLLHLHVFPNATPTKLRNPSSSLSRRRRDTASADTRKHADYFRRWSKVVTSHGLLAIETHATPSMADRYLMAGASVGLFPRTESFATCATTDSTTVTCCHFETRPYRVRHPNARDIASLMRLETRCWPAGIRMPRPVIDRRIRHYPNGQLVVELEGAIAAAVYTQRITDVDALRNRRADNVHVLHRTDGPIVQLLALNVTPETQDRALGDQLLAFALQRASLITTVDVVVGVTRCKNYGKHKGIGIDRYVDLRTADGHLVDPVLRMHERHGARVQCTIPNYRPKDRENDGIGVLVAYNLRKRQQRHGANHPDHPNQRSPIDTVSTLPVRQILIETIAELIGVEAKAVPASQPLMEMGIDSAGLLVLNERLSERFRLVLDATFFFEHNTVDKIVAFIEKRANPIPVEVGTSSQVNDRSSRAAATERTHTDDIAIIGISCRLPGQIDTVEELWECLRLGKDLISRLPADRWKWPGDIDPQRRHHGIDWGGFLDRIDTFDAGFFRITPKEAELMDPQQRLLLELSWNCLEDAGYAATALAGSRTGVYIGASGSDYHTLLAETAKEVEAHSGLATSMAVLANRLSYFYDFHGPSLQIDTACSSSLVALYQAIQALRTGVCDQALIGGVHLMCHPANTIAYYKAGMLSKDGRCKTFDESANGYVRAEGAVVMLLKPLDRARADGDAIYAVIKGAAVNHGGEAGGLTVPNPARQTDLVIEALNDAGVSADTLTYIEAHGTGTALGDPVEIRGLADAFARLNESANRDHDCALGSLKTNLGHLEAAAGIAGLLKVVLCLRHRTLPPSIHFHSLNPKISLDGTPFRVVTKLQPWKDGHLPRRAGVSSFGSGGANAHVIVEEYVKSETAASPVPPAVVILSARTPDQLRARAQQLLTALERRDIREEELSCIAYTLQTGRMAMPVRFAAVTRSLGELRNQLSQFVTNAGSVREFYIGEVKPGDDSTSPRTETVDNVDAASLAAAWVRGTPVDWHCLYRHAKPTRAHLPGYPFAGERFWISVHTTVNRDAAVAPSPTSASDRQTCFFIPDYRTAPLNIDTQPAPAEHWVILCDEKGADTQIRVSAIRDRLPEARCVVLSLPAIDLTDRFTEYAIAVLRLLQEALRTKPTAPMLIQIVTPCSGDGSLLRSIAAVAQPVRLENSALKVQWIGVEADETPVGLAVKLIENRSCLDDTAVCYRQAIRHVAGFKELSISRSHTPAFRSNGVYLITGGAGGLGLIVAQTIAATTERSTLVLTGRRSKLSEDKQRELRDLESRGARVIYRAVDVGDQNAVEQLVNDIVRDCGALHGVVHAAGILQEGFLYRREENDARAVLVPKVHGAKNLDEATKTLPLELFVLFSSIAAVFGNVGQADYAVANAFLDAFAHERSERVRRGVRSGRTLSVNWPYWADGGMRVHSTVVAQMRERLGVVPLTARDGMDALTRALSAHESQIVVMSGDAEVIRDRVNGVTTTTERTERSAETSLVDASPVLRERTLQQLKNVLAEVTKLPHSRIDAREALESYGIDSIMISQLNEKLADIFEGLSKTVFFEYQTLAALRDFLIDNYSDACATWSGYRPTPSDSSPAPRTTGALHGTKATARAERNRSAYRNDREPIAIVGISGRFPGANDVHAYWENLKSGKDCVGEIPPERWSLDGFYVADPSQAVAQGKSYSKWGGFIDGFANFDPLFFNISPREAMTIDPQERLFLQSAWEAVEDAGYSRERIAKQHGGRVGVFAGVTKTGFELHGPSLRRRGEPAFPITWFGSIANRVSYVLNLRGPSMPVDTMCSASLTAIHEACEHLLRDECEMAIAGGVNIYTHPTSYSWLSAQRMLSVDGRCRSFGKGGNGFVPGEGAAVVVLKRLSDARAHGDRIYGLIRATSINHGGKTNGYTVPNPAAQRDLVRSALQRAGISARAVSYIEAHGTGTELGDPIEVAGLTQAFRHDTQDVGFCAIGSVKSNIGHLESAAGAAGLIKVLLQMQHRTLVPSLHADATNPNIDFERTPFVVQRTLGEWKAPRVTENNITHEYPRIAGISSFGAGGANAHIIVEEYIPEETRASPTVTPQRPAVFVLSAKSAEQLKQQARRLQAALIKRGFDDKDLADIAYTLQVGRESMEHRLGFLAVSLSDVQEKLQAFLDGKTEGERINDVYTGATKQEKGALAIFNNDEDTATLIDSWLAKEKYAKLIDLWTRGLGFDWERLYDGGTADGRKPMCVSLPTYPFAQERYWIADTLVEPMEERGSHRVLHPLLHENTSTLDQQRFSTTLTGDEFFLRDHRVAGSRVLPGVCYLEMMRAAVARSLTADATQATNLSVQLRDVVWLRPFAVGDEPKTLHISLSPQENEEIVCDVYSVTEHERAVHATGRARIGDIAQPAARDVSADHTAILSSDDCYARYRTLGIAYGPAHQGIAQIGATANDGLRAELRLPPNVADTYDHYVLHPSLIDSAFQATLGFSPATDDTPGKAPLPFALDTMLYWATPPADTIALLRHSAGSTNAVPKFDIDLCTTAGEVCVRLEGFSARTLKTAIHDDARGVATTPVTSVTASREARSVSAQAEPAAEDLNGRALQYLKQRLSGVLKIPAERLDAEDTFEEYGIDSILVMQLTTDLEQIFGSLSKTLFFEYQTLGELTGYFVEAHRAELLTLLGMDSAPTPVEPPTDDLKERALEYLKHRLSVILKLPTDRLDADDTFEEYGIDSILVMQLTTDLEQVFGPLSKTLFFEYQTLGDLTGYFVEAHRSTLLTLLGMQSTAIPIEPLAAPSVGAPRATVPAFRRFRSASTQASDAGGPLDVAIVGLSGRYPKARTLEEFWQNLKNGIDGVVEIPAERWDHARYFDPEKGKRGKTYSKWGGFIDDVDKFDPLFFGISPREAERIEPQERLFLECAYGTLEDAGYTAESLRRVSRNGSVGVFVGVMYEEYPLYGTLAPDEPIALSGNPSSIANRVSYFMDFRGPSFAVDTMCSSSLTAIHLACESIRRGDCAAAIAGGVNVSIHPNKYLILAEGRFASSKGRCESFGEGGDGYVPSEGVGAVLLKPLAQAIEDRDHIYAVIKATSINHGGKTNGYTVPNPNAQYELVRETLRRARVNPRGISYLEAHGTGTSLGDPIEIAGLTKAFAEYTNDKQYCPIGSVKSNIGHLESAAGIASLTKVLLQMQHRTLIPGLHAEKLNPHIDFANTPFSVQRHLDSWDRPVLRADGKEREYPRIAGISSFGAGGSNAHMIVEEYVDESTETPVSSVDSSHPVIFVLSAKNADRLKVHAQQFHAFLCRSERVESELPHIAYTLQVGREAMDQRLAFTCTSLAEARAKLERFLTIAPAEGTIDGVHHGQLRRDRSIAAPSAADGIAEGKYDELLERWVRGLPFDWETLHHAPKPRRVSLPTYPFAKERYWIGSAGTLHTGAPTSAGTVSVLHPLVHKNTSTLDEQRFASTFTGEEFFFSDHIVQGRKVLPGVCYLEMLRTAFAESLDLRTSGENTTFPATELRQVVWLQPFVMEHLPRTLHIAIGRESDGDVSATVYASAPDQAEEEIVHAQARLRLSSSPRTRMDLAALRSLPTERRLSSDECYDLFQRAGLTYGPAHRGLESLQVKRDTKGTTFALAELGLPSVAKTDADKYAVHPGLLDSALQACMGLIAAPDASVSNNVPSLLPFAMETMTLFAPPPAKSHAYIRHTNGPTDTIHKFDIDICDEAGYVCTTLKGLTVRALTHTSGKSMQGATLLLEPAWIKANTSSSPEENGTTARWWIVLEDAARDSVYEEVQQHLSALSPGIKLKRLNSQGQDVAAQLRAQALDLLAFLKERIAEKPKHPVRLQLLLVEEGMAQPLSLALAGMLRTATIENPRFNVQAILAGKTESAASLVAKLQDNIFDPSVVIRYRNGDREIATWRERSEISPVSPWKDGGVYLITGGMGGLGVVFAREIASKVAASTLILTGRSPLNDDGERTLDAIRELGASVMYRRLDVSDAVAVQTAIDDVVAQYGRLNGVLHAAGILRDSFLIKKSETDLSAVFAPKVDGALHLDRATKDIALDGFYLFSSITGAFGNVGQADYATANAFLDAFAGYRNQLVGNGQRHGQTIAINWPLWRNGGMGVDNATLAQMRSAGFDALTSSSGIEAFYRACGMSTSQVVVLCGDRERLKQKFLPTSSNDAVDPADTPTTARVTATNDVDGLQEPVRKAVSQLISRLLKIRMEDVDVDTELGEFGFDSVSLTELSNTINQTYGTELSPAIFFEYPTIRRLAGHLIAEHASRFASLPAASSGRETPATQPISDVPSVTSSQRKIKPRQPSSVNRPQHSGLSEPIAIIGVSGCFPGACDLSTFWENLKSGQDCIGEIPRTRWDWRALYGDPQKEPNKTNIKWGGFIDEMDEFDPLFFGISPREAQRMDPAQRLLMTHVWKAIEDAGYASSDLSGTRTAMLIGTASTGYDTLLAQTDIPVEGFSATGVVPSVGPNRMSYLLNLHGPSEPIETACSSSLVAIHRAVRMIRSGECDLAIAGGINLIVTPTSHLSFSKAGMLSVDGRCKTFAADANGYVRGEGVGILFLKALTAAERDGDHIYGLIRGSAENHGGRANSLTAPNPNAQADVIKQAIADAGIDGRTITYIEAHGTGTPLGDPIEIQGLKKAFKDLPATDASAATESGCAIGSVKTNIGHLELAAGVAGVIKVLLQFKHRTRVASLHCREINPYIDLSESAFYLLRESEDWKTPKDSQGNDVPRRAGVSSFGFGGVNAHVVLEEYVPASTLTSAIPFSSPRPAIIVLSAKNEERLTEYATRLREELDAGNYTDSELPSIAYTLQVGRDAMEHRLAFTATSLDAVRATLDRFVAGKGGGEEFYLGEVKHHRDVLAIFSDDEDQKNTIEQWLRKGKYNKVIDLWTKGLPLDWRRFYAVDGPYGHIRPRRISLPTYPFAKERYWLPLNECNSRSTLPGGSELHPLLQRNTSTLSGQRFSSTFTGNEFFISDHVVQGRRVLPAAAQLEMARAAFAHSLSQPDLASVYLDNVTFIRPIVIGDEPLDVHVSLTPRADGTVAFEITGDTGQGMSTYSQGQVVKADGATSYLDRELLDANDEHVLGSEECYAAFARMGLAYGAAFQGIRRIRCIDATTAIAELQLPAVTARSGEFVLHPSLLDSALQTGMNHDVRFGSATDGLPMLPFAVERVEIFAPIATTSRAIVRESGRGGGRNTRKQNFEIVDSDGRVCVRVQGLASRTAAQDAPIATTVKENDVTLVAAWDVVAGEEAHRPWPAADAKVAIFGGRPAHQASFGTVYRNASVLDLDATDSIRTITEKLTAIGTVEHIVWIVPASNARVDDEAMIGNQIDGVVTGFRLIKALLELGYGGKPLGVTVLTEQAQAIADTDAIQPGHASVHGMIGALAKEYPHWKVRLIDVAVAEEWPLPKLLTVPPDTRGNAVAYRNGEWYRQQSLKCTLPSPAKPVYRQNGVYVILGGAGGIGEILSEYLIRRYQAQVIWIGRRPENADITAKRERLGMLGIAPYYLSADATNRNALQAAYEAIKARFGVVHGVVHSTIVLNDQSLARMTESVLLETLAAKVDVSVRMAQVFRHEPLDFVLFFSSLQSFTKTQGQSNYAAGCTFADAWADSLRRSWSCPVKVVNWGYWRSAGVVASREYEDRMAKLGIGSIEPSEAMEMLERLLAAPIDQATFVRTTTPGVLETLMSLSTDTLVLPTPASSAQHTDMSLSDLFASVDSGA